MMLLDLIVQIRLILYKLKLDIQFNKESFTQELDVALMKNVVCLYFGNIWQLVVYKLWEVQ